MIVTLMNGTILRTIISNCTGYVAKRIEIEAKDVRYLRDMLERNPAGLRPILAQLEMRFPEMRAPLKNEETHPAVKAFRDAYPHQRDAIDFMFSEGGKKHVGEYKLTRERQHDLAIGYGMPVEDADHHFGYHAPDVYAFPDHAIIPRKPIVFDDSACIVDECSWFRPQKPDHQLRNLFWFFFVLIFTLFS